MKIFFIGAHNTGKTTAAKKLAELLYAPYIYEGARELAENLEYNVKKNLRENPLQHLFFQAGLTFYEKSKLEEAAREAESGKNVAVVIDRSPLDIEAYLQIITSHHFEAVRSKIYPVGAKTPGQSMVARIEEELIYLTYKYIKKPNDVILVFCRNYPKGDTLANLIDKQLDILLDLNNLWDKTIQFMDYPDMDKIVKFITKREIAIRKEG